jgi:monovalent cation:H+ antiporter-2, CPA2 family
VLIGDQVQRLVEMLEVSVVAVEDYRVRPTEPPHKRFADEVRRELYAPITRQGADDDLLAQLRRASREIETEWVRLPESDTVAGKTIGDLRIRSSTGVSIVAVVRGEEVVPNPGSEVVLRAGDLVGILGTPDQRRAFRALTDGA